MSSPATVPGDEGQHARTQALLATLTGKRRLLLLTHTNPDPDSIASAMGIRHLVREKLGLDSAFGLSGRIMRAENQEMVKELGFELTPLGSLDLATFDCAVLVDTQPGFGHTQLPEGRPVDVVIDHHVPPHHATRGFAKPTFVDVRTEIGATSSMVTGYLMDAGVDVPPAIATGLFYGIQTDTADLARDASPLDIRAYEFLVQRIDRTKLAAIRTPDVPIEYFRAFKAALNGIRIYGDLVLCTLGHTQSPEMVAEVADLLLRLRGVDTVFVGGLVNGRFYLSVRTQRPGADAYPMIRGALRGEGSFGGHGQVAGGNVPLKDTSLRGLRRLERRLEKNILKTMGAEGRQVEGIG